MLRAPEFWWRPRGLLALSLAPLALLYGWVAAARMKRVGEKISVPVICIGNLVAGGAGKTPTAIAIAKALQMSGKSPVFLTSGYGGKSVGPVRVDLKHHTSREVGDEALLLAKTAPTIVAQDRLAGAHLAVKHGDVVMMDDGFQNPAVYKDCSIVVIDTGQGIGNGLCLPAGPLRAPIKAQWAEADLCLLIGDNRHDLHAFMSRIPVPVYCGRLVPQSLQVNAFKGLNVFAFAGIGRPDKFFDTLDDAGAIMCEKRYFADHYRYTAEDIALIISEASEKFLIPVTTAKDAVKIAEIAPDSLNAIRVLDITLQVEDGDGLMSAILSKLP